MAEENNKKGISKEEYYRILNLPVKTMTVAGREVRGRFDAEKQLFYQMDEAGNLTGRAAHVGQAAPMPEHEPEPEPEPEEEMPEQKFHKQEKPPKREKPKKQKKPPKEPKVRNPDKKKSKHKIIFAGALLIALMFAVLFGPQKIVSNISGMMGNGEQSQEVATENKEEPEEEPKEPTDLSTLRVIQVTKDMIPGDQITEESIQEASISAESYNVINLSDNQVYQWDRHESLIGSYISEYVPVGQFLTYSNVSATQPRLMLNPWIVDENIYTDIPIAEDMLQNTNLTFGAIMNLSIKKESVTETTVETPEKGEEDVAGMEHSSTVQQSYIVDTYSLNDIVLCDLINSEGESIYNYYIRFMSIPVGERADYLPGLFKQDPSLEQKLTPAYITICVSKEQMNKLGDLSTDGVSITVSFTGQNDLDSNDKKSFSEDTVLLKQTIQSVLDKVHSEQEEVTEDADE